MKKKKAYLDSNHLKNLYIQEHNNLMTNRQFISPTNNAKILVTFNNFKRNKSIGVKEKTKSNLSNLKDIIN